ncbi:MAG TPA: hypothetical protein VM529_01910 [Gemmata sp.]|nr:hypothetical protein [Gemmata sp.]
MTIDFLPTLPVAASLAACVMLPVALLVLSHGPFKVTAPGRRFVLAAGVVWTAWVATMIAVRPDWVDLVTGALLLATATLAGFTLWTLVAWGFTVSMLLALARADRPLTVDGWALAYTRGKPLAAFAQDRLGVLLKLGLAEVRGGEVVMTPRRGRAFAKAATMLRRLFGLSK